MKKRPKLILHNLIEREGASYTAICLELNVATEGRTVTEAEKNLKEAVELYLDCVYEDGAEAEFIPRPAEIEVWLKYFRLTEQALRIKLKKDLDSNLEFNNLVAA